MRCIRVPCRPSPGGRRGGRTGPRAGPAFKGFRDTGREKVAGVCGGSKGGTGVARRSEPYQLLHTVQVNLITIQMGVPETAQRCTVRRWRAISKLSSTPSSRCMMTMVMTSSYHIDVITCHMMIIAAVTFQMGVPETAQRCTVRRRRAILAAADVDVSTICASSMHTLPIT
jgi:hypothetical protein